MEQAVAALSGVLLVAGALFMLVGSAGMVRLPDVFTRMHAAGMTDTMGAGLILAGLALHSGFNPVTARVAFVLVFVWFTSPIATHAVAKAALSGGVRPYTLGGRGGGEGEAGADAGAAGAAGAKGDG